MLDTDMSSRAQRRLHYRAAGARNSRVSRVLEGLLRNFRDAELATRFPELSALDDDLTNFSWIREHVFLTQRYCIKTSTPETAFLVRNEARALRLLEAESNFPKVAMAFDHGAESVLVTERLAGSDLTDHFSLAGEQRHTYVRDAERICGALARHHIEHRDITPRNLRVADDQLILFDFEFAKIGGHEIETSNPAEKAHLDRCVAQVGGEFKATSNEQGFENVLRHLDQAGAQDWVSYAVTRTKRLLRT